MQSGQASPGRNDSCGTSIFSAPRYASAPLRPWPLPDAGESCCGAVSEPASPGESVAASSSSNGGASKSASPSITAGCDCLSVPYAALTGLVAGLIVVVSCFLIDRVRVDDPVGAISVHGVCGVWGTLAVGLFAKDAGLLAGHGFGQLGVQAVGVAAAFAWAFPVSFIMFHAIHATVGLRVSPEEEMDGLDVVEHGIHAYPPSFITGIPSSTPGAHSQAVSPVVAVETA